MKTPIFASDTSVPVDRTRAEINKLLTAWQCAAIGWTDHLADRKVSVEFTWHRDGSIYRVRFTIGVPVRIESGPRDRKRRWDAVAKRYYRDLSEPDLAQAWRSAHRLLLLKLKADLNAAQAGLAKAEEIFLPWMVGRDGATVAEVLLPRLRETYAALPPAPKAATT